MPKRAEHENGHGKYSISISMHIINLTLDPEFLPDGMPLKSLQPLCSISLCRVRDRGNKCMEEHIILA